MVVFLALLEYKVVHYCYEEWVDASYTSYDADIYVCFCRKPHGQKLAILDGKVN